ncbi:MAG TPA: SRPBCC family protein [Streptomyces sp.]|nr:SRPBCC family protein [Streptomyces sp.]
MAQSMKLLTGAGHKLGESTNKLNDIADGKSPGFAKLALDGGKKLAEGKGPVRGALEVGATHLKDKAVDAFKGLGGKGRKKGGGGNKPVVIMEHIDVGVPLREAYDQWTQYGEFSNFAKGVKSASAADDTTSDWKLKVFWSNRSWKAHTTEQVPDARIQWTSEGGKGTTKGVVTFHALGETLTRVLLVIEYYPKGLFEKTGNIWRAQGRRARLDLKHFARHISMKGEAEDGWRGEIRDGEVVRTHEDAIAAEEEEAQDAEAQHDEDLDEHDERDEDAAHDEHDEDVEQDEDVDEDEELRNAEGEEEPEDDEEYDAEVEEETGDEPEAEEEPEGEYEEPEEEYEEEGEDADSRKKREYARAGSRSRR